MKILTFVDLHGSLKALNKLQEKVDKENPDAIVCAGDISIFEQNLDYLINRIAKFKKPVFLVQGNHEDEGIMALSCKRYDNLHFIHGDSFDYDGVLFLGWGGGGFSLVDKEFEKVSKQFKKKLEKFEKAVLVTHAPPYKTRLDKILEESCGNKSILNFIKENTKKIRAAISGHLHENSGTEDHVSGTRVINPGPFGKVITI